MSHAANKAANRTTTAHTPTLQTIKNMNNDTLKEFYTPFSQEELIHKLSAIRHVALDMDGTIYMGSTLFPWTKAFLAQLDALGIGYSS